MPYTVGVAYFDLSLGGGALGAGVPTLAGGIYQPLAASGPGGGLPTPTYTGAPSPGAPFTLLFPSATVPPGASCGLLVRDTTVAGATSPGDLFRSGPVVLPPSPATLNLWVAPPATIRYSDVDAQLRSRLLTTIAIDPWVAAAVGSQNGFVFTPQSLTPTDLTLELGPTITVTVTGKMHGKFVGFIDQDSGFSLKVSLAFSPSSDVSNAARILAVTSTSPILSVDAFFLAPAAALALAMYGGSIVASAVGDYVNQQIAAQASAATASQGKQLTSTAVLSCGRLTITRSGLSAVLVVGDLFGPGLVPLPQSLSIGVSPRWQCGVAQDYVVTVLELTHGTPVSGARVALKTGAGGDGGFRGSPEVDLGGTTDANGKVELKNVTLRGWVRVQAGQRGEPPVTVEFQPVLNVSASGFNKVVTAIPCPAPDSGPDL